MKLKTAQPIPTGADIVAELDRIVANAEQALPGLYDRLEELKASGARWPIPPSTVRVVNHRAAAEAILAGDHEATAQVTTTAENELFEVEEKIARLKLVVDLGRAKAFRLRMRNAGDIAADLEKAWRANLAALAGHLIEMAHLADERKRLADEYVARTGVPHNFGYGPIADRLSRLSPETDGYQFLRLLRAAGIIA